jgi:ribosomal-protein-serine acetyltransferase
VVAQHAAEEEEAVVQLALTSDTVLRSLTADDAATLFAVVDGHRDAFDPWLRWSGAITSTAAATDFIAQASERERTGHGFHLGLWRGDALIGGVPCWSLDPVEHVAELGYWLLPSEQGKGLAALSTRAAMAHLFNSRGVERVEFRCLVENAPSRRLAERLGGVLVGMQTPAILVGGACREHALYELKRDG